MSIPECVGLRFRLEFSFSDVFFFISTRSDIYVLLIMIMYIWSVLLLIFFLHLESGSDSDPVFDSVSIHTVSSASVSISHLEISTIVSHDRFFRFRDGVLISTIDSEFYSISVSVHVSVQTSFLVSDSKTDLRSTSDSDFGFDSDSDPVFDPTPHHYYNFDYDSDSAYIIFVFFL